MMFLRRFTILSALVLSFIVGTEVVAADVSSTSKSNEIIEKYMLFVDTEYNWNWSLKEFRESAPENINRAKVDEYLSKYLNYQLAKPMLIKEFKNLYSDAELSGFNKFISSSVGVKYLENVRSAKFHEVNGDARYSREVFGLTNSDKAELDSFYSSSIWKSFDAKVAQMYEMTHKVQNELEEKSSDAFDALISN